MLSTLSQNAETVTLLKQFVLSLKFCAALSKHIQCYPTEWYGLTQNIENTLRLKSTTTDTGRQRKRTAYHFDYPILSLMVFVSIFSSLRGTEVL